MAISTREVLGRVALVLGSLLATLLLVELGLRWSGYEPTPFPNARRIKVAERTLLLDCYPSDPRGYFDIDLREAATYGHYEALGVRSLERARGFAPFCVEARYNSERYRDAEFAPPRAGVQRIAVVGDSFSEGWGVKQQHTYPRILGQLLDEVEPGGFEVLNYGRRGEDLPSLYQHFEKALEGRPDLVIYGMVLNDAEKSASFQEAHAFVSDWILMSSQRRRRRYNDLGPFESRGLFLAHELLEGTRLHRETTRWYLEMYADENREGWQRTREQLERMRRDAQAGNARLLVIVWPLLVDLDGVYPFRPIHDAIRGALVEADIRYLDLLDVLEGRDPDSLAVFPVDLHPNEVANRLVAESVVPVVREILAGESNGS